jgi:prolyl oligopeptidase
MTSTPVRVLLLSALLLAPVTLTCGQNTPPVAAVRSVTDTYFGTSIDDPYRYMENTQDPEVQAWIKGQARYTRAVLDSIPGRAALLADIEKYADSSPAQLEDFSIRGKRFFYEKRNRGDLVARLYVRDSLAAPERLLIDPMANAPQATHFSLSGFEPSWDGKYVVVGVAAGGSEAAESRVLDVATGNQIDQPIPRARFFSVSWLPDSSGFFYNQLQEMKPGMPAVELEQRSRVFLHLLHGAAGSDRVIFGNEVSPELSIDPVLLSFAVTTPGSRFVSALATTGVSNRAFIYISPLDEVLKQPAAKIHWSKFADIQDPLGDFAMHRDELYFTTSAGAPNYKVMRVSAEHPDMKDAKEVIPEQRVSINNFTPGSGILPAADALYVTYLEDGLGKIMRLPYNQTAQPISLPFAGNILRQAVDPASDGLLFSMTTWTRLGDIYAFAPATREATPTGLVPQGPYDNPPDLVSEEVEAPAKDGVMVPLSIVHKKGISMDGKRPTILEGYGSYGISTLPEFRVENLAWFERGGILAYAHTRGGGERGDAWYKAGKKATKPNTWRDAIACAEYLVARKYASPETLAIESGSAGGIFVGRSITERPDLFAVGLDHVPMSDTLRVELTPNGPPNIEEFGSVKTEDGFKALYEMSAYHHVAPGTRYPAVLITTGINDPRVDPSQPAKLTARLQATNSDSRPVLLRVDYDAGHGMGSTRKQRNELRADSLSFTLWQFGDPAFQPRSQNKASPVGQR